MNRTCFTTLHELIRTEATLKACMGHLSNGPIESDVSLVIVLRMLSGASMLDLAVLCGISTASVYYVFKDTMGLLQNHLQLDGFPGTEEVRKKLELGFRKSRNPYNTLRGCVGASNGISVKIGKPKKSECGALSHIWCRKGYYSLPVQAVVDSRYRFLDISAKCVGSTHNYTALSISSFRKMLDEGKLPKGYWIAADEAYTCTNTVITPIMLCQAAIGSIEDGFNFYRSSLRIHIEQAFGQLLSGWNVFETPLKFSLKVNAIMIHVAAALHNFCVANRNILRDEKNYNIEIENSLEEFSPKKNFLRVLGKIH